LIEFIISRIYSYASNGNNEIVQYSVVSKSTITLLQFLNIVRTNTSRIEFIIFYYILLYFIKSIQIDIFLNFFVFLLKKIILLFIVKIYMIKLIISTKFILFKKNILI
jgi:hypothetical protein